MISVHMWENFHFCLFIIYIDKLGVNNMDLYDKGDSLSLNLSAYQHLKRNLSTFFVNFLLEYTSKNS